MKYFNVKFKKEKQPRILSERELERLCVVPEWVEEIKKEKVKPVKNQEFVKSMFEG